MKKCVIQRDEINYARFHVANKKQLEAHKIEHEEVRHSEG